MVEIPHPQAKRSFVMPAQAGIQVTDSVRHTVENRGDDKAWIPASAGMTEGRKSTSIRRLQ
jgi:hypothetical protein